jgi:hypothetical protein
MSEDEGRGGSPPPGADAVTALTTAECWRLIEGTRLGRLALVDAHGDPEIFPVNYVTHDGVVYVRTAAGTKTRHIRSHPTVAIEVDGEEAGEKWSVLVRGSAVGVSTDDEIRRSGIAALSPDTAHAKPYVVRIDATAVTGRRFAAPADRPEPPHPLRRTLLTGEESGRPTPIPHSRPFPQ